MLSFIQPGKPGQNAFIGLSDCKLRVECLNEQLFYDLTDTQTKIEAWRIYYNKNQPHRSLNQLMPGESAGNYEGLLTE
jgi:putative transposase